MIRTVTSAPAALNRLRIILVLLVGLVTWSPVGTARAHLEHGPATGHADSLAVESQRLDTNSPHTPSPTPSAAAPRPAPAPLDSPRHPALPAAGLLAGAFVCLVAIASRRNGLALALVAMLALPAAEGVFHAALHLGHVSHGDGLAIGVSASLPSILDADADAAPARPLPTIGATLERPARVAAKITRLPDRGRAPPPTPA